jgi:prevent-host-death family protein
LAKYTAMNVTINIAEAKNRLSELLEQLKPGEEITICKRNIPFAKVTPMPLRKNKTVLGFDPDVKILGPITGPIIPEEDWNMLREDFNP